MRKQSMGSNRREFLKTSSTAAAAATVAASLPRFCHAAEDNLIRVALVGCGGRGTGAAANALSTTGPVKLVAMADVFDDRLQSSLNALKKRFGDEKVDVPPERQYLGFDAYRKAIDTIEEGDLVLLTTPPAFRPLHLEYAVERGRNVFMEKSFAVDAPGVRRVLAAGKKAAEKNLKIAGGLMCRHYLPLEQIIGKIHDGAIGDVVTLWAYREHGPVGFRSRREGESELAHQIRNYSCFTWVNGSFLLDWLIHNLDVCCWVKGQWPVSAQGQGGRQVRDVPDQLFDHYAVEYRFADGTKLFAQGRHMANCWGFFGDIIHGTKGSAVLGEGINDPKLYSAWEQTKATETWRYTGEPCNHYQREHDLLFDAIRQDKPYNEAERCAYAAMVGILGRMAVESGKEVTWETAMNSDLVLAPELDNWKSLDDPAPVQADENGRYPIAMPGFTKAF
ncbi:MAG: gfo/Idh/MocA family oxidoreductase [Planctomycetota bacterium]|nr:MAG: gfo/Idh/MocA family oxidoreductase [Planctomycetota bacterium]